MSILNIENLKFGFAGKTLYQNANLKINKGEHVALIGLNGSGKSTLLNLIAGKFQPDAGTIELNNNSKIGYLDQHLAIDDDLTVEQYLKTAFQTLFEKNELMEKIYDQLAENYDEKLLERALKLQTELDNHNFIDINKQIRSLVVGLNIDTNLLNVKLNQLSSGQKSKTLLAKLLLSEKDFLLLDEPTNFLDTKQVNWLAEFLQFYPKTFLVISHDNNFINKIANIIYEIENQHFTRYVGNFEFYLSEKNLNKDKYLTQYKLQQKEIEKLETFIAKNRARASKAKSAQSRQKVLDKMVVLQKPKTVSLPHFNFKFQKSNISSVIEAHNLVIGYEKALTNPMNFIIREGEKWLVLGHNGIGKTTLLKTITKNLIPIKGNINVDGKLKIGYFYQNIIPYNELNALEYMLLKDKNLTTENARNALAKFAIKGELMLKKIKFLSGGEQTKVQLAALSQKSFHILILDEPTNHLDSLAKTSLIAAINNFGGTVIMTTHDSNLNQNWANNTLDFKKFV